MILFWILWVVDAIVALITLCFFFVGLKDGSVSSFNSGLWTGILIALVVILGGSWYLRTEHLMLAKSLLAILAIPGILYGLFMLIAIFSGTKWN
jgi:hypothetical protein